MNGWPAGLFSFQESICKNTHIQTWNTHTRPFSYDLNKIPSVSTVKVRNRFKGLDLTDRVPDELWMEAHDICTGDRDQDHPQEKEMQKSKMAV